MYDMYPEWGSVASVASSASDSEPSGRRPETASARSHRRGHRRFEPQSAPDLRDARSEPSDEN